MKQICLEAGAVICLITASNPPPMAGFFEFSLMRTRGDIDQKLLSELYYQYLNVEEDFIKDLLLGSETRLGRVFVQEEVLSGDNAIHILDFERACEVIKTASHIGVGMCFCRHKMQHKALASKQLKSRYLETLCSRIKA